MFSPGAILPWRWMAVTPCNGQRRAASAGDARDLLLGHAGIVLEFERGERAGLAAAQAGEGDDRADIGPPARQRRDSRRRGRNPRPGSRTVIGAARHAIQPPVMGGKKAISRAPAIGVSGLTCAVDGGAHDAGILEGVGVFLAARREPGGEVGHGRHARPGRRPLPPACRCARAPRRNRRASWRSGPVIDHVVDTGAEIVPPRLERQQAAIQSRTRPIIVVPGSTVSPAGPAIRKPTATSCSVVFHFAMVDTGTLTRSSARYSRSPETRISRDRMTIAAQIDQLDDGAVGHQHQQAGRDQAACRRWGRASARASDCCDHARAR